MSVIASAGAQAGPGWERMPPGPEPAARLAGCDLAAVDDFELIEVLRAARRQTSWTQSVELAALAEVVRDQLGELLGAAHATGLTGRDALLVAEAGRRIKEAVARLKTRWCVITIGPDGQPRHGHDGYRPPAGMRRLIAARDRTCVFPGCHRRAEVCDQDHTVPYHRGGATCPCNLAVLCRRHHRVKQTSKWRLTQLWPGLLLWITPSGHWHLTGPDP